MHHTLPLIYFRVDTELSTFEYEMPNQQKYEAEKAWCCPQMQLLIVCIAKKEGDLSHIKGGAAVLTSVDIHNTKLTEILVQSMAQSALVSSFVGNTNSVFILSKGVKGSSMPEPDFFFRLFYQECFIHGAWGY